MASVDTTAAERKKNVFGCEKIPFTGSVRRGRFFPNPSMSINFICRPPSELARLITPISGASGCLVSCEWRPKHTKMTGLETRFTTLYPRVLLPPIANHHEVALSRQLFVSIALFKADSWFTNTTSYASFYHTFTRRRRLWLALLPLRLRRKRARHLGTRLLASREKISRYRLYQDGKEEKTTKVLTYVDIQRLEDGAIEPDYNVWVQKATQDGLKIGIPKGVSREVFETLGERGEGSKENMVVRNRPATA